MRIATGTTDKRRPDSIRPSLALLVALVPCTPAAAQGSPSAPGEAAADADIVVTATGYRQRLEDAPASITIVDGADLRRRSVRNLGDALRDVEGVTVNGAANETDIQIRGMAGDYTLILVDGKAPERARIARGRQSRL